MANLFGRKTVAYKLNNSGVAIIAGDVVVPDTSANNAFTTTTSAGVVTGVWVADESIANGATGRVVTSGHVTLVNVSASVTRGHTGATHTVAKQAASTGTTARGVGTFCKFTTGGTTPEADIWPVDLLGSSLTNPMTTTGDIIQSSDNSGTPARLAAAAAGKILTGAGTGTVSAWGQGPLTTTGDLMIGATGGTPTRLAVGAAGTTLAGGTTPAYVFPPGYEYDYVEITSSVNVTATTEGTATTVITGSSVAYDGSTVVYVEFYAPFINPDSGAQDRAIIIVLYDGASSIGKLTVTQIVTASHQSYIGGILGARRLTPSNASHTYSIRAFVTAGTGIVNVGAGGNGNYMPGFIRVRKV